MERERFIAMMTSPEVRAKRTASLKALYVRKGLNFRLEKAKKSFGHMTAEQKSERSKKAWATRKAKAQLGG